MSNSVQKKRIRKKSRENKQKNLVVYIIFIILISDLSWLLYFFYGHPIPYVEINDSNRITRYFWVYPKDLDYATLLIENDTDKINIISPTLYSLGSDGILESSWLNDANNKEKLNNFISLCKKKNIEIQPLLSGPNDDLEKMVYNATLKTKFINKITETIREYGFDGINIDFEGMDLSIKDAFYQFLNDLHQSMPDGIKLSIDLPALAWKVEKGWGAWCDYSEISKIVDQVMIMTYDAHGGFSDPGEIAPINWVEDVISYARWTIPSEKLFIGIPRYGYDWSTNPNWQNVGFGFSFFKGRYIEYGGTITRTNDGYELKYIYTDEEGFEHIAYYCDANTTAAKETFLSRYNLAGYCYWHLASGDPSYFN